MGGKEIHVAGDIRLCRCEDCGIVFRNPRPSVGNLNAERDKALKKMADALYKVARRPEDERPVEVMKDFFRLRKGVPAALNGFGKRVLEINCGTVTRLVAFEQLGWETHGIDPSEHAIRLAGGFRVHVRQGQFDAAQFKSKHFDLVACYDFSTMPDPAVSVKKIAQILRPKGLVFICTPRIPFTEEGVPEKVEPQMLFYYDNDSMRRLLAENGLKVVEESEEGEPEIRIWAGRK
jgi:SAM-dependent methyltransferase